MQKLSLIILLIFFSIQTSKANEPTLIEKKLINFPVIAPVPIKPISVLTTKVIEAKKKIIISYLEKLLFNYSTSGNLDITTLADLYTKIEALDPPPKLTQEIKTTISRLYAEGDLEEQLLTYIKTALIISKNYISKTDSVNYEQVGVSLIISTLEAEFQKVILGNETTLSINSLSILMNKLYLPILSPLVPTIGTLGYDSECPRDVLLSNHSGIILVAEINNILSNYHNKNESGLPRLMMIGCNKTRTFSEDDLRISLAIATAFNRSTNTIEPNKLVRNLVVYKLQSALQEEILGATEYDGIFNHLAKEVRVIIDGDSVYLDTLEKFIESYEKAINNRFDAISKESKIRNQSYLAIDFPNIKRSKLMISFAEQAMQEAILHDSVSSSDYFGGLNFIIKNTPTLSLDSESEKQKLISFTEELKNKICPPLNICRGGICNRIWTGTCPRNLTQDEIRHLLLKLRDAQKQL